MSGIATRISSSFLSATRNQVLIRAMSSAYLINNTKYGFLKELGLEATNFGVYDGTWKGSGNVSIFLFFFVILIQSNCYHNKHDDFQKVKVKSNVKQL